MWCKVLEKETFTDAAVVALSKKFIWVEVNRDHTPDIPKKFNVSAYPSLITLGKNQEKVHRFSSFKKPPEFIAELTEALKRYDLYVSGKEWDTPNPRPETITGEGTLEVFPAPSKAVPAGIAMLGGDLWIGQVGTLFRLSTSTGEVLQSFPLNNSITDLCTDGRHLYGVESGWTAGKPIHQIDPATGETIRAIVTEANKQNKAYGAKGIACRDGKLYVLSGMEGVIHEVDPATGEVAAEIKSGEKWLAGLDFDGKHFVAGSRTDLFLIDPDGGGVVRRVPVNYPLRAVGAARGAYYLMEQPIFGFDTDNKQVQVWPKETVVYKLILP